jgi:adenylate cyclase
MAKKKHKEKAVISVAISAGALIVALFLGQMTTFLSLENNLLDYRFKIRGPLDVSESPIVILAIDDQSDESTPHRWPWPRYYFAHVIENLNRAGVKAIGIDVIFDQPDINGPASDSVFAATLKKYKNVIISGKTEATRGPSSQITLVYPYDKFVETGVAWGLVSFDLDADGFYRRYLVGQAFNDSIYGSFAVEVLKKYLDLDPGTGVQNLPDKFKLGPFEIPKYNSYSTFINYAGPAHTFPFYSFDAVLDDSNFDLREEYDIDAFDDPGDPDLGIPPGLLYSGKLKDKIVLIGATMQELHDEFPTPFLETRDSKGRPIQVLTNGVEIHANVVNMILTQNYLRKINWGYQLAIIIFLVILVYLFVRYLPTLFGTIAAALLVVGYFAFAFWIFTSNNLILDISTPILAILFSFGGYNLYQYVLSQHERKMIQGAFSHYVPEKVVKEIIENPDRLTLGGEERVITVMFSDVAGFTSISEKLTPAKLVQLLNEYLTEMTDIILANDGIIDKYEGDAIMAEFGMPVPFENHAQMACKAALQMQKKLYYMREKWQKEGKPQLRARIGINTGEVIVGNMGSKNVFDYTVMGDHVNLGSRLEGANKFYGTAVMISEYTYDHVKSDFYTRELDLIRVKGKEKPIKVFELIASKEASLEQKFMEMLDVYAKGLTHYKAQEWDEAIDCFENCLKLRPEDTPSSEYRSRCIEYKFNSPGPDWDGVTVMKEK